MSARDRPCSHSSRIAQSVWLTSTLFQKTVGPHMTPEPSSESQDPWTPFRYFLFEWRGTGTGRPGTSQVERSYRLVLQDQFIEVYNRSVYEPQESNPEGEVHEDLGIFSYDKAREKYVLREFHVEGYVNQYVAEKWDQEGRVLVMTTEAIENIPPGWRARTTYEILSDDEFRETFELAGPGKLWACYITLDLKREKTS